MMFDVSILFEPLWSVFPFTHQLYTSLSSVHPPAALLGTMSHYPPGELLHRWSWADNSI